MVASKGLTTTLKQRRVAIPDNATASRKTPFVGAARNFRVFTETDKDKLLGRDPDESIRNSVPLNSTIDHINARDSKMKALNKLEKGTGKHDAAASGGGRKALADISNFRGNSSGTETRVGSKCGKGKREQAVSLQRASIGLGTSTSNSSARKLKFLMGKPRTSRIQTTGDFHNGVAKDCKAIPSDLRTKVQGPKIANSVGRKSARNLLPPTRKSLPVLKKVNEVDTTIHKSRKGNAENIENCGGKCASHVKPKVDGEVVPHLGNAPRHLCKNQLSRGFVKMASGGRLKGHAQTSSRTFLKQTVKTTVTTSKTQGTSKSKWTSVRNKSSFGTSVSSKRKEKSSSSSASKETISVVHCEQPARQQLTSDRSNYFDTTTSLTISRGCDRRKSYTSLLIARTKLIKEPGKLTKLEYLPHIDDDCNQLEVAEYVDEIYQYYWVMEVQNRTMKNYMKIQVNVTPQMRGILINWLIEVHLKFGLMQETLFLMVTLLDQYLSLVCIKKNKMQLVGLTALLLASKYEDFWHPKVMELISISAEWYTRDQMLGMEMEILQKLKFRLNTPTPYVFMLRFLKAAQSDTKLENLAFYLIELCLVEYEGLHFKSSLLCASAIYVARRTLQITPAWTPLLGKHAHYEEYQLRDCAEMILRFHKAAGMGVLKVTYEKYMSNDKSRVAAIKPLDTLPN